jgi:hypothetical protein
MRFLTLLKKEFREAVPWFILATLFLSVLCLYSIRMKIPEQEGWYPRGLSTKNLQVINGFAMFQTDIMEESAGFMFYISIGLGLILAVRHFLLPGLNGTWQFLIHRSVTRRAILSAKLIAAAVLMLCLSLVWLLLAGYTYISEKVIIPAGSGIECLGIFYAFLGFLVYMGTGICAIIKARWYTTRTFGLFFVLIMFFVIFRMSNLIQALVVAAIVFGILIVQIYQTFLEREF